MEASNKWISPLDVSVVLFGDMAVFAAFVIFGEIGHGMIDGRALIRTALPFAMTWCIVAPWFGVFRASAVYSIRMLIWKIPLTWMLCGMIALLARALLTEGSLTPVFVLVALTFQGVLLVGWRGVYMLVSSRVSRL